MHYQFFISNVHGKHCTDRISKLLRDELNIHNLSFSQDNTQIDLDADQEINTQKLNHLLTKIGNYTVSINNTSSIVTDTREKVSYKPIYLIFAYLIGVNALIAMQDFHLESIMINFMASFFLVFSFFKMLDLKGFAEGYSSYDIIARKFYYYGYIYPFLELGFGLGYLLFGKNFYLNIAVFLVMIISSIGVIKAKFGKQQFHCACVGTFLKIPLGNIAIIEDLSMVVMSLSMLISLTSF